MALPDDTLSSIPVPAPLVGGRANPVTPLVDYETGGIALEDASEGLQYQTWRARVLPRAEPPGSIVRLEAEEVDEFQLLETDGEITQFSFSFDRNMRLHYAWVEDGVAWWHWYDTQQGAMTTTELGDHIRTPRVTHDDKRDRQSGVSDVILAYVKWRDDEPYDCEVPAMVSDLDHSLVEDGEVYTSAGFQIKYYLGDYYYEVGIDRRDIDPETTAAYRHVERWQGVSRLPTEDYVPYQVDAICYREAHDLCYRQQRDRYQTEYTLRADIESTGLRKIGMNSQLRLQFELEPNR